MAGLVSLIRGSALKYEVEVIPIRADGLRVPRGVGDACLHLNRKSSSWITRTRPLNISEGSVTFEDRISFNCTVFLKGPYLAEKKYELKLKSHSGQKMADALLDISLYCRPGMAPQTVKDSLMLFPSGMITFKVTTKLVGGGDIMMNADSIPSGDLSRTSTVSADDSYSPGRAHLQSDQQMDRRSDRQDRPSSSTSPAPNPFDDDNPFAAPPDINPFAPASEVTVASSSQGQGTYDDDGNDLRRPAESFGWAARAGLNRRVSSEPGPRASLAGGPSALATLHDASEDDNTQVIAQKLLAAEEEEEKEEVRVETGAGGHGGGSSWIASWLGWQQPGVGGVAAPKPDDSDAMMANIESENDVKKLKTLAKVLLQQRDANHGKAFFEAREAGVLRQEMASMGSKLKSVEHQKEQVERDLAQTKKQLQQLQDGDELLDDLKRAKLELAQTFATLEDAQQMGKELRKQLVVQEQRALKAEQQGIAVREQNRRLMALMENSPKGGSPEGNSGELPVAPAGFMGRLSSLLGPVIATAAPAPASPKSVEIERLSPSTLDPPAPQTFAQARQLHEMPSLRRGMGGGAMGGAAPGARSARSPAPLSAPPSTAPSTASATSGTSTQAPAPAGPTDVQFPAPPPAPPEAVPWTRRPKAMAFDEDMGPASRQRLVDAQQAAAAIAARMAAAQGRQPPQSSRSSPEGSVLASAGVVLGQPNGGPGGAHDDDDADGDISYMEATPAATPQHRRHSPQQQRQQQQQQQQQSSSSHSRDHESAQRSAGLGASARQTAIQAAREAAGLGSSAAAGSKGQPAASSSAQAAAAAAAAAAGAGARPSAGGVSRQSSQQERMLNAWRPQQQQQQQEQQRQPGRTSSAGGSKAGGSRDKADISLDELERMADAAAAQRSDIAAAHMSARKQSGPASAAATPLSRSNSAGNGNGNSSTLSRSNSAGREVSGNVVPMPGDPLRAGAPRYRPSVVGMSPVGPGASVALTPVHPGPSAYTTPRSSDLDADSQASSGRQPRSSLGGSAGSINGVPASGGERLSAAAAARKSIQDQMQQRFNGTTTAGTPVVFSGKSGGGGRPRSSSPQQDGSNPFLQAQQQRGQPVEELDEDNPFR